MGLMEENKAIQVVDFDDKKKNVGNQIQVNGYTEGLQFDISWERPKDT